LIGSVIPAQLELVVEELLERIARAVALTADSIAVVVIALGTIEAVIGIARALVRSSSVAAGRALWLRYAQWLVAGLTFQLAADIVETTIAPTWDDIGQVAAIAAIRTMLTYFLDRDIVEMQERTGRADQERDPRMRPTVI
jgi:uncharacterized membrane protein